MKKFTTTFLLLTISFFVQSQTTITIPDANFEAWLTTNIPAAISGNQLDTSHTLVKTMTEMDLENNAIADLTGVQYFINLRILDCGNGSNTLTPNTLSSLPPLPGSLKQLICGHNQLTSLPTLPTSLDTLKCYRNSLTSLPTLPNSITFIDCHENSLTSLPSNLPSSLRSFDCGNNQILVIPTLPTSLYWLSCYSNQLTSLPDIPVDSVYYIDCHDNQISSLPDLPLVPSPLSSTGGFQYLDCSYNLLTTLPTLPIYMTVLKCHNNQLTTLPTLPSLSYFYSFNCSNNQLTSLPEIPFYLNHLICNNNAISCFPNFPNSLTYIEISSNPFTCLPNYVSPMDATTLAYPLCSVNDPINNPHDCPNAELGILGFVYEDVNNDCMMNNGDTPIENVHTLLFDDSNNLIGQTYTAVNGIYNFPDSVPGTYTVKVDTANVPFMTECIYPGVDSTVTLTVENPIADSVNFGFKCKPGFDIGVRSVVKRGLVFPGEKHRLIINAGDMSKWYNLNCASSVSGQVVVTVDGPVTYDTIQNGSLLPVIAGNQYTYDIADFGAIDNSAAFGLIFITDTTAQADDTICVHVSVTPTLGDNHIKNNSYEYCYNVINSHDPNMKEVYPVNVSPGYSDWFTYTIHFQNTGNAPAINIRLADTLDELLDLSTFEVLNYSHTANVTLNGNNMAVHFPQIYLPDSTTNLEGSKGFIQYRIKPKANLPLGTQIENTAFIYFDYNSAIVTNTTINKFTSDERATDISTSTNENSVQLHIYPNPSSGHYFVNLPYMLLDSELVLEVYNLLGEQVINTVITNDITSVNLEQQPNGVYFFKINGEKTHLVKRVIKN